MMMAAAAFPAGVVLQVGLGRNAAEFKSFVDELVDALLQFVHFLLGVDERLGDGVVKEGLAVGFEGGDFHGVELQALVLFFMEGPALFGQALVELAGAGVGHE